MAGLPPGSPLYPPSGNRAYLLTAGMLLQTCTASCRALPQASRMVTGSAWGWEQRLWGRATWAVPTGLSHRENRVWPSGYGQQPPQSGCVPVHAAYKSRLFSQNPLRGKNPRCYFRTFNW